MENTLITLAGFHYDLGFIGIDEYRERVNLALWLSGQSNCNDPRIEPGEEQVLSERINNNCGDEPVIVKSSIDNKQNSVIEENNIEYLFLRTWIFTKADQDFFPSVPHGHYNSPNNSWPKLNPYTGRAFISKHQEDIRYRLTKDEMTLLWKDATFKSFCREMVIWYCEQFPYYKFPVLHPLRMPRR